MEKNIIKFRDSINEEQIKHLIMPVLSAVIHSIIDDDRIKVI